MKILVLCYEYPPVGGGGGNMARNIASALSQRGHDLKVQTVHLPGLLKKEIVRGVEINRSYGFRRRRDLCSVPEMGGYLFGAFFPALKLAYEWKPDVIHAHFAVPSGALALALRFLLGIPYALTVHLGDLPGGNPDQTDHLFRFLHPPIRQIWRKAAGISASSQFAAGLAKNSYGISPEIILNGISMEGRPKAARLSGLVLRLAAVGRFNEQKNFPWMIRALARCDFPWTLDLIGDGSELAKIQSTIIETATTKKVRLRGWLSESEMRQMLADSDILLMPSISEGNPISAIEALKQGVAIVGSKAPGLSDLINSGENGYAVEIDSPEPLINKLNFLATDRQLLDAMKSNSLNMSQNFDIEEIAKKYENFLLTVSHSMGKQRHS